MMSGRQYIDKRRFPHRDFAIIITLWCLASSGWAQSTNIYHTNRVFHKVTFTIPGVPTAFEVCNMAGQLTTVVGPTNVITNGFYATERQSIVLGHESSAQAWSALLAGYPTNSMVHSNKYYDNAGWVKGMLQTRDGNWGGYIWLLQNTVKFKTSATNMWVSTNGVTNAIFKVLVGTIGDYSPMADEEDTGPGLAGLTNWPTTGDPSNDVKYKADFTAYYDIGLPYVSIQPILTNVCINSSNVIFTLITNSYVTNGVTWSITPTNGVTLTSYPSNAVVNVGGIATSYVVKATANDNTNIFGSAILNVVKAGSPLQYKIGTNGWADMPDPLYVCKDTAVDFKAQHVPREAGWPSGKPVWSGLVSGSAVETNSYTFSTFSTSATDYKIVFAECGNTITGKIIVCSVVVTNIKFNHDMGSSASDAINIRYDYNTSNNISNGEWVKGGTNIPVCYTINKAVTIKARFTVQPAGINNADIWAVSTDSGGSLGDVVKANVTFVSGVASDVIFQVSGTTPNCVKKTTTDLWAWKIENVNGSGSAAWDMNTSGVHTVYTILAEPVSPWDNTAGSQKNAWTKVLDYSCDWAATATDESSTVEKITTNAYAGFGKEKKYSGQQSRSQFYFCHLSVMLATNVVDCQDMSAVVQLFTRILGGATVQVLRVDGGAQGFYYKRIQPIGASTSEWTTGRWAFHQFGWHADSVNDACVKLKESAPYVPVHDDLNGNYKTNLYDNVLDGTWNPLPPRTIADFD